MQECTSLVLREMTLPLVFRWASTKKVTILVLFLVPPVLVLDLIFLTYLRSDPKFLPTRDGTRMQAVPRLEPWRSCGGGDEECCKRAGGAFWATHQVVPARFTPFFEENLMSVYMMNDFVSEAIQKHHRWDIDKTKQLRLQLRNLGPDAVLLDIGANIGWFSLMTAYSGYRVIAVEPFEGNVAHFRHSLCLAPPEVRDRITLLHVGLGMRDGEVCELWHDLSNRGNFNTVCNGSTPQGRRRRKRKLGTAHLFKLDTLVDAGNISLSSSDKVIVKIDTEGFEPFAFLGAEKFLRNVRPIVIYSEYSPSMIQAAAKAMGWTKENAAALPENYIRILNALRYSFTKPNPSLDIQELVLTAQQGAS